MSLYDLWYIYDMIYKNDFIRKIRINQDFARIDLVSSVREKSELVKTIL